MLVLESIQTPARCVEIPGTSFPFRVDFERRQNFGETESGRVRVFDRGVEVEFIGIKLQGMTPELSSDLENFIRFVARYRLNSFFFFDDTTDEPKIRVRYWDDKYSRNMVNFNLFDLDFVLRVEP